MTLGVNLVTPPAFEPVSLARARAWLTSDVDGFAGSTLLDPELESMIRASRQWVERETDRTIGLQHLVAFQDGFYGMGNLQTATLQGNYQLPIYGFERNYWQLGIELPSARFVQSNRSAISPSTAAIPQWIRRSTV